MTALRTKLEGFQTQISKYFPREATQWLKRPKISCGECLRRVQLPRRQGSPLRGRGAARTPGFPTAGGLDARVLPCVGGGLPGLQGSPLRAAWMPGFSPAWERGCPDSRVPHCGLPGCQGSPLRGRGVPGCQGSPAGALGPQGWWGGDTGLSCLRLCPPQGDYRQLVHELDEAQYAEIRLMVMEIRNLYAILYDIVVKNFEKIKKPRGETKGMIY
ncbi:unnamed protein product [Eretmochelys imbricata]